MEQTLCNLHMTLTCSISLTFVFPLVLWASFSFLPPMVTKENKIFWKHYNTMGRNTGGLMGEKGSRRKRNFL